MRYNKLFILIILLTTTLSGAPRDEINYSINTSLSLIDTGFATSIGTGIHFSTDQYYDIRILPVPYYASINIEFKMLPFEDPIWLPRIEFHYAILGFGVSVKIDDAISKPLMNSYLGYPFLIDHTAIMITPCWRFYMERNGDYFNEFGITIDLLLF